MSSKVWVVLAVTLISFGAAIALAGIPRGRSVELSDVTTASTTEAPPDTDAAQATDAPPAITEAATSTAVAPATSPATGAQTSTTPAERTTTTTATTAVTPTTRPPVDRVELSVVVANGASLPGVAGEIADRMLDLGYTAVRTLDGAETFERSTIFAAPGLQAEAEQLAIDIGIDPSLVFPISAAPELLNSYEEPLMVYLGADVDLL